MSRFALPGLLAAARLWACLGLVLLIGGLSLAWSQTVQPVPALSGRVIDQTGTLSATERQTLESQLADFERSHGSQVVALLVSSTQPEDIASYANRVANAWKIGRRALGDGVLIIVAKEDRRMRIEVAKGLEGAVPDLAAARIIDQQMVPRFRTGDFAGGLQAAIEQVNRLIQGENLPLPPPSPLPSPASRRVPVADSSASIDWFGLGLFLLVGAVIAGSMLRRLFGRLLGPLLTGAAAAGVAYLLTGSTGFAALAGLIGFMIGLMTAAAPARRQGPVFVPGGLDPFGRQGPWVPDRHDPFRRRGPVVWGPDHRRGRSGPIIIPGGGGFSWPGGSTPSGSGGGLGGDFGSGGGGDFGGGGASGNW